MHPEDRHTIEAYRQTVQSGEPYSAQYRMRGLDGRTRCHHRRGLGIVCDFVFLAIAALSRHRMDLS